MLLPFNGACLSVGGASGSQSTGAQSRNRSPRRDNGYASRSSGGTGHRGLRSSNQTNDSNNHATRNSTTDSGFHRPSMPNSVARSRNATSSQGRSNALPPLPLNEYSPLRGGRSNGRQASRQHGFGRPVLRQQNTSMRSVEPRGLSPLEGPSRNVPSVSPSLHGLISSSEDSDSESGSSPMSPPSHQSSASLTVMSDPRGKSVFSPLSTTALLALWLRRSTSGAEDPGFESRLGWDSSGVESYQ